MESRSEEDITMQIGGVGQTGGEDIWVRETTTINQWQQMRAKVSYGKPVKASMPNCWNKV